MREDESWRVVSSPPCPRRVAQPLGSAPSPGGWLTSQRFLLGSHFLPAPGHKGLPLGATRTPSPTCTWCFWVNSGFWKQWLRESPHPASGGGPQAVTVHMYGLLGKGSVQPPSPLDRLMYSLRGMSIITSIVTNPTARCFSVPNVGQGRSTGQGTQETVSRHIPLHLHFHSFVKALTRHSLGNPFQP